MPDIDALQSFGLDDRVAIVTGASSGLGQRFARVLDAAGAKVVVAARRVDRLEALAAELSQAYPVRCDLSEPGAAAALVDQALEELGRVDILVNNAGKDNVVPALEEQTADFRKVVEVNLVAPFELARSCAAAMVDSGGGAIVNVASILGVVASGRIPQASYAASKGGLVNLTRELAAQWATRGIRVNALAPGWFPSEMTDGRMFGDERAERFIERHTPMRRGGREHELDGALLFLASDASSFVTGQVLCVDGGWTAV